ncbi:MAG: hypothetical protein FRX48_02368 [Lasallia pustulata]|uniref:Uncharacterized protein n=1 Tax=Lasallia pustulata TaxID=136370 RepID=A0A5M8PY77_9LECA|nr:MAG: hypothetical protein FRX48_02368 [Lasallia pustulata]
MSKALESAVSTLKGLPKAASKFSPAVAEGSRIIPSKARDNSVPIRIDAGKFDTITKMLPVIMQVNSQAKSPGLTAWRKKHSSHAKLATENFDTAANDKDAEYNRVLDSMLVNSILVKAKESLGK